MECSLAVVEVRVKLALWAEWLACGPTDRPQTDSSPAGDGEEGLHPRMRPAKQPRTEPRAQQGWHLGQARRR